MPPKIPSHENTLIFTQSAAASGETADRLAAQAASDVKAVEAQAASRAGGVVSALLAHVTTVKAGGGGGRA